MVKNSSYMFITGPDVVKQVLNEDVSFEDLGGASVHSSISGVCHFVADDETQSLTMVRELLSYLPQNNMEDPPPHPTTDDPLRTESALDTIVPENPNQPYDIKRVIELIVDDGHFFEVHEDFAANIVCGYARLGGTAVGIVANQPMVLAGVLDIKASEKAARFVRTCDAFNVPLITFVDCARLSARHRPGTQRHHHERREAAFCLLRGDRAQTDSDDAQSLRRRLLCDEQQAHPRRLVYRLGPPPRSL